MKEQIETTQYGERITGRVRNDARAIALPKIRAGIAGAGLMGGWHAHALERAGGVVAAIADTDIAKAESLRSRYPAAEILDSVESMLETLKPDVLHICSATDTHQEVAERAIREGIHVLVEKPLAASEADALKLFDLAAERNTLVCPVHQFVFQDGVEKAMRRLPQVGRLIDIEVKICSAGGNNSAVEHLDSVAFSILPHPLSLAQRFLKSGISSVDWEVKHPEGGELRIYGTSDEISLSIFVSMNSRPTINIMRLAGTGGSIYVDLFHGYSIFESGRVSRLTKTLRPFDFAARSIAAATANLVRRSIRREPAYPGLRRLIREFYRSIRLNAEPPIRPDETLAVARACESLVARAEIGKAAQRLNG